MEAVGASASILTFITVAFSVSKSIHETLSTIRDGPEILRSLNDELSQLETILQRFLSISFAFTSATDISELERLVKKCQDDLVGFNTKICQLDVSGGDGRRGRLWRKLKICFEEKDLEHIRAVVRSHAQLLTLRLSIIQAQQLSLTATQSTEMLSILQQLQQSVRALQISEASVPSTNTGLPCASSRVTELEDEESPVPQETVLDETIARLMRLLEKKPCVVESEESEELVNDLERLLQSIQKDFSSTQVDETEEHDCQDVSKEIKLVQSLIMSSPSMMINQSVPADMPQCTTKRVVLFQNRKRRNIDTDRGTVTMTTIKRRRMMYSSTLGTWVHDQHGQEFLAGLTYTSNTKKQMLALTVSQKQAVFDRFTSMLPRVIVSNILPLDSPVFEVAAHGSVKELMQWIVGGKTSLHDHDEEGWSLLHYAVGNLPVLKFLIQQGLDVNEIGSTYSCRDSPLHGAYFVENPESFAALLQAGADPTLEITDALPCTTILAFEEDDKFRNQFRQLLYHSPFAYAAPQFRDVEDVLGNFCSTWAVLDPQDFDPAVERKTLDLLFDFGYCIDFGIGWQVSIPSDEVLLPKMLERRELFEYATKKIREYPTVSETSFIFNAYKVCHPCSMSKSSLWGDFWDTIFDRAGYDTLWFRELYPRRARYQNGYTREHFEELWRGREKYCPYWDDKPWPHSAREGEEQILELNLLGQLCYTCILCGGKAPESCYNCGICRLVYRFSCQGGPYPHEHDCWCPRSRVGYWEIDEETGFYGFRPKGPADEDSEFEETYSGELTSSDESQDCQSISSEYSDKEYDDEIERDHLRDGIIDDGSYRLEQDDSTGRGSGLGPLLPDSHEELYSNPWES